MLLLLVCFSAFACSDKSQKTSPIKTPDQPMEVVRETNINDNDIPISLYVAGENIPSSALIKNGEIVSMSSFRNGKFPIYLNATLVFKYENHSRRTRSNLYFKFLVTKKGGEIDLESGNPNEKLKPFNSFGFYKVTTTDDFTITMKLIKLANGRASVIKSTSLAFEVFVAPQISIVQPSHDVVLEYGKKIKFIANAIDKKGNFPTIIWITRQNNYERIIGFGYELTTSFLDFGNNAITAYALDTEGNVTPSNIINIMIPYHIEKTKIIKPKNNAVFNWDQSVYFYARGNNLEYSLDDQPFKPGSGFLEKSLEPGPHKIEFKGKFGSAIHQFHIREKMAPIARFARVDGYVMMSGKQGDWIKVKSGDELPAGYIVRAVGNGLAELHLTNGLVYILNLGKSIRILENGNIVKNFTRDELALYSLVDSESINEIQKNLQPMISQLDQLLTKYEITELEAENKEDIIHLLDLIFKGQLKIDEIVIE